MSPSACRTHLVAVTVLLQLSMGPAAAAASLADELAHCAAIAAADARLTCYDGLAGRARIAGPAPAPAAAENDPHDFGLAQVQVHEAPTGPSAIQAHVAQLIGSGATRESVVLDNGQTWSFTESAEEAGLRPGDPVTVRRAALGSFMLVTPSKHAYHVHRTR